MKNKIELTIEERRRLLQREGCNKNLLMEYIRNHRGENFYKDLYVPNEELLDYLRVPNFKRQILSGSRKLYLPHQKLQTYNVKTGIDGVTRNILPAIQEKIQKLFNETKCFVIDQEKHPEVSKYVKGVVRNPYFLGNSLYGTLELEVTGRLLQYEEHFTIKPTYMVRSTNSSFEQIFDFVRFGVSLACQPEIIETVPAINVGYEYDFVQFKTVHSSEDGGIIGTFIQDDSLKTILDQLRISLEEKENKE